MRALFVRFLDWMDSLGQPPDWRVEKSDDDGLWYVLWEHLDQGWIYDEPGYPTLTEAAAAGRRRFGGQVRG